jgi:squalene-associated FAD-dependent desaturase
MAVSGPPIAVIGAGWAGCAAAITLAAAGQTVQLIEAGPVAGGRARRVVRHGLPLDNGQHLLLGAYRSTRELVARLHPDPPWTAAPLAFGPWGANQPGALALRAWRLPAPLGLLAGLLTAGGLSWGERVATLRWFGALKAAGYHCPDGMTVTELTAAMPTRVSAGLWHPLCLAALNTQPDVASAQVFANVLRDAFDGRARDTEVLRPSVDLSALVGDATSKFLEARCGVTLLRTSATVISTGSDRLVIACNGEPYAVRAAIVAVGPHQLAAVLAPLGDGDSAPAEVRRTLDALYGLAYEPITTVYLGYAGALTPPKIPALTRLDDAPGQWLFDRRDILARAAPEAPTLAHLLAVVISAAGPHGKLDAHQLVQAVDRQLRRLRPDMPALAWSQVIAEQRATYACTHAAVALRRSINTAPLLPGLFLAGDYLDIDYPATLEAAVRSGNAAARALLETLPAQP